jgi:hypothetical protein
MPQSRLKRSESSRHSTANGHWHEYFWPTVRPAVEEKFRAAKKRTPTTLQGAPEGVNVL